MEMETEKDNTSHLKFRVKRGTQMAHKNTGREVFTHPRPYL